MLTRRALLLALWLSAATAFPALATLDPIVVPAINRVPDGPLIPRPYVTPNTPPPNVPSPIKELRMVSTTKARADVALAKRYDDGKVYVGAIKGDGYRGADGRWYPGKVVANHIRSGGWFPGKLIGRFFKRGGFFRRGRC